MNPDAALGLVMLIVMIGVIFIGFPISFTLLFLALGLRLPRPRSTVFSVSPISRPSA